MKCFSLQVEPKVLQVLDRLILYLRIVHSVDYYNHCEYPNEDEMPNRCGIIHTRGTLPTSKVINQPSKLTVLKCLRLFKRKSTCPHDA